MQALCGFNIKTLMQIFGSRVDNEENSMAFTPSGGDWGKGKRQSQGF
jgi:hypothetical protein